MDFIRVNKTIYFIEYMLYTCINYKFLKFKVAYYFIVINIKVLHK